MLPRRGADSGAVTVPPLISIAAPPAARRPQYSASPATGRPSCTRPLACAVATSRLRSRTERSCEWLGGGDHTGALACTGARREVVLRIRSDSRSATSIVGRFVLARGTAGKTDGVGDPQALDAEHAALGVDDRPRVVGRAHAAGPADVARVADRLHQPRVDGGVVGQLVQPAAGHVDRDAPERRVERAAAQQLERALDAVARADEVGIDVEQVLIDQRVDIRIGRREREPAVAELLVEPQAQQPGTARRLAAAGAAPGPGGLVGDPRCEVTSAGRARVWLTDTIIMSFSPAPSRPDE